MATFCLFCGITHTPLCLISLLFSEHGWIFWGFCIIPLLVHSSSLSLRSPCSVPGCSNKYDKWGYRCLENELWSESLWCLTLLMKYLDESMYSHFVLRTTHCFAIEHILFSYSEVHMCVSVSVYFPHFSWLSFLTVGDNVCVVKATGLSLRVVKRLLSRLCDREMNFQFYTHADCGHTHICSTSKLYLNASIHPNEGN